MIEILLWITLFVLFYAILGYPLLLIVFSKIFGRESAPSGEMPKSFTFLIAAHNEEAVIRRKIENSLSLAEPGGFDVQVIVVSDGSSDRTFEEADAINDKRLLLLTSEERSGKAWALNQVLPLAEKEVLIFTDANSLVGPGALQAMAERLSDPKVGGVCGEILVDTQETGAINKGEGLYWRYDQAIKRAETRLGGAVSAQGSFYAIRREYAAPIPLDCADDFYNSVGVVAKGGRLVFSSRAQAVEQVTERAKQEMNRRIRSTERGWRALLFYKQLMNPFRHGWYAWQLFSHKFLRRLTPFIMVALFILSLANIGNGFWYDFLAGFQIIGCVVLAFAAWSPPFRRLPVVRQLFFFGLANLGMALGIIRYLLGHQSTVWNPVRG